MKDSEKLKNIIDAAQLNIRQFALEIGLENAQPIYNIVNNKHGISNKMARLIVDRFPDLASYDDLISKDKVQIGNKGVNIQADNSKVNVSNEKMESLKFENQMLRETITRMERELDDYRNREKTLLNLLSPK